MHSQLGPEGLQQEGERSTHVGLQGQCLWVHSHGPRLTKLEWDTGLGGSKK